MPKTLTMANSLQSPAPLAPFNTENVFNVIKNTWIFSFFLSEPTDRHTAGRSILRKSEEGEEHRHQGEMA